MAHAAILVYDVSKFDTFENCTHWGDVLADRFDRKTAETDFVTIVACNKIDMEDEHHAVEKEDVDELVKKIGADEVAYISALNDINVDEMWERLGSLLLRKWKQKGGH